MSKARIEARFASFETPLPLRSAAPQDERGGIGDLPTPSLLVDLPKFDANVARMRSRLAQAGGPDASKAGDAVAAVRKALETVAVAA